MNYLLSALGVVGILIVIFVPVNDLYHCAALDFGCFRGGATSFLFGCFIGLGLLLMGIMLKDLLRSK